MSFILGYSRFKFNYKDFRGNIILYFMVTNIQPYGSSPNDTPINDKDWRTLAVHNNDSSLLSDAKIHTWKVNSR